MWEGDQASSSHTSVSLTSSILVLSAGTRIRTPAAVNHRIYADRHGLECLLDATPSSLPSVFHYKAAAVERALAHYEWVFWMDDDAFFTNLERDLRAFIDDDADLVICASPINPEGGWTYVSFGQFLIRRTPAMVDLLRATLATDLEVVRRWWEPDRYGIFTNTDQDALVYQLARDDAPWAGRWRRLDWQAFNSRPYHYRKRLDEHFLCHFVVPWEHTKMGLIREFAERLGTTTALVAPAELEPYATFIANSEVAELLGPPWATPVTPVSEPPPDVAAVSPEAVPAVRGSWLRRRARVGGDG